MSTLSYRDEEPSFQQDQHVNRILKNESTKLVDYSSYVVDQIKLRCWNEYASKGDTTRLPDFSDGVSAAKQYLDHAIEQPRLDYHSFFRLKLKRALIESNFYGPIAFSERTQYKELREYISNLRLYESIGQIIDEELDVFLDHATSPDDRSALRGIINESTALGLLNRVSHANTRLALLSDIISDSTQKTDINLYRFTREGNANRVPIQIKSSDYFVDSEIDTPVNGVILLAKDFFNDYNKQTEQHFIVSRLVVSDSRGEVDDDQSELIDAIVKQLINVINDRLKG